MSHRKVMGALLAVLLAGPIIGLLAGGCSDTKGRTAARRLLEEIETARRLYARAVSLMASAPVKVAGQYIPPRRAVRIPEGSSVELPSPFAVHPEAWDSLVKAQNGLSRALVQYGQDSGPQEQALASMMLGNILMLKADYQLASAAADRQEARDTVALAGRSASLVQLYKGLVGYYHQLVALGDRDVLEMLSVAQQQAAQAKRAVDQAKEEIATLRAQAEERHAANERLIPQARQMRLNSQQSGGRGGMELLEQVLKIEGEINESVSALAALENTIELREAALGDMTLALQGAEARREAADAIIAARKGSAQTSNEAIEAIQRDLSKARNDVQEHTARLARVCERVAVAEDAAAEAYSQAVGKLQAARRLLPRGQDVGALARLADAHWALAELKDQGLTLRQRNMLLVERLAAAWSDSPIEGAATQPSRPSGAGDALIEPAGDIRQAVPAFARGILAYVPNPEQARKDAIENYQQAGDLYQTAARTVPSHLRWAYQGQAAAAYIALYRLSGDAEVLTKAKEALSQALEDKRESSYLAAVVELEKLLQAYTAPGDKKSVSTPQ